jgi:restriction system protein
MKKNEALPMHVQFFLPMLEALRSLGGSATRAELKDKLVEMLHISADELEERLKTGVSRIENQIVWSKVYLVREGLVDDSNPEVLTLTEKGLSQKLNEDDVIAIFKRIHGGFVSQRGKKKTKAGGEPVDLTEPAEDQPHKRELLDLLRSLSPDGFERLCQLLLRVSGFKKVEVKGRSGDGGIDGEGILEINPLVSLKVIFQSKRYKEAVSASQVRDFRGAMQGRAEKGIFITTGRFTADAKAEAVREGVPPIELVDGDKLVQLFEQRQLGLKQKVVYEVDHSFFDEYH